MDYPPLIRQNVKYFHRYITFLGCIESGFAYFNKQIDPALIYGASGFAFAINISDVLCPSGPTGFKFQNFSMKLLQNLGVTIESKLFFKSEPQFIDKQKEAFQFVQQKLTQPTSHCFGWELDIPEYYNIIGVDGDKGYFFLDLKDQLCKGPKMWNELGNSEIQVLEVCCMQYQESLEKKNFKDILRDSLNLAIDFSQNKDIYRCEWFQGQTGIAAYDIWIKSLEQNKAMAFGLAYNTQVWYECRMYAEQFLQIAYDQLKLENIKLAINLYKQIAENIKKVGELYPFLVTQNQEMIKNLLDSNRAVQAIQYLKIAKECEIEGIELFKKIVLEIN